MRNIVLVTGAGGLIGSETARFFSQRGHHVVGIDNDMRRVFFGPEGSTEWNQRRLVSDIVGYRHVPSDIRDEAAMRRLFEEIGHQVCLIVHCAAQPSHDWATRDPVTDFTVNANGTLILLEMTRRYCPEAVFIFTSTNKVYGDRPNRLPLVELETRWEVAESHPFHASGIDESMPIDQCLHSVFGASKVAADVMVQEYGRYFAMKTACFRGGCLTGPAHSATELHGFLAYLMKCCATGAPYTIFGHGGKQVRDNIHSHDLVNAFWHFFQNPRSGEVYNLGGGRGSNCSMLEAIALCEDITGRKLDWHYEQTGRIGDHIWWISNNGRFESHFPDWSMTYGVGSILEEIHRLNLHRWREAS